MAGRVAVALALVLGMAGSAPAAVGTLERSGYSEALLGRWESALSRLQTTERASTYFRARALLELGLEAEALELLRSLAQSPGAFAGPALELGVARLFDRADFAGVVRWADAAVEARPQDPDALHYFVGQSRSLSDDPGRAAEDLRRVAAGGYRPYALHALAVSSFLDGASRDAVELLGAAEQEAASSLPDRRLGSALADRIRLSRGRMLYQTAVGAAALEDEDRRALLSLARAQFRKLAPQSPFHPDALRGEAWCSVELGDSARALAAFEAASPLDPSGRHEDLWGQGRTYQRAGFPDEAARLYGEARTEAMTRAQALEGEPEPPDGWAEPEWGRLRRRAAAVRERLLGVEDLRESVAGACSLREARYRGVEEEVAARRRRAAALDEGLRDMSGRIQDYLDRVSAVQLFPREVRPRLQSALDRQERLGADIVRFQAALAALEGSELWAEAAASSRSKGEDLWARLEAFRARLAETQLAFLAALKERVSVREEELNRQISSLLEAVGALEEPLDAAGRELGAARARLQAVRDRLAELSARAEAASGRLEEVERGTVLAQRASARRGALDAAGRLRLRADEYALDETQALHLWRTRDERGTRP